MLLLDEEEEAQYLPSRWTATFEAVASKVFWDGFMWERFALLSTRGLGQGPTTAVRPQGSTLLQLVGTGTTCA